jgi:hypothetical protein
MSATAKQTDDKVHKKIKTLNDEGSLYFLRGGWLTSIEFLSSHRTGGRDEVNPFRLRRADDAMLFSFALVEDLDCEVWDSAEGKYCWFWDDPPAICQTIMFSQVGFPIINRH